MYVITVIYKMYVKNVCMCSVIYKLCMYAYKLCM